MFRLDSRRSGPLLATAVLVVVLTFLTVWSESRVDRLQVRLDRETRAHTRLVSRVKLLRTEVLRSTGLREVEGQAIAELGLVTPSPERIALLDLGPEPELHLPNPLVGEAYAAPSERSLP